MWPNKNFWKKTIIVLAVIAACIGMFFGWLINGARAEAQEWCSDGKTVETTEGFCCAYIKTLHSEVILIRDGDEIKRDRTLTPSQEQIACEYVKKLRRT